MSKIEKDLPSTLKNEDKVSEKGKSVKELSKELCNKSSCHHKCPDTDKCVVEEEAELLIKGNKSNNFDVKSNNEIEEMAKDLCTLNRECEDCPFQLRGIKCNPKKNAERFIAKGYRKQSEGEWKALTSICFDYICTNCGEPAITYEDQNYTECYHLTKFCPECGAKMKGGAK